MRKPVPEVSSEFDAPPFVETTVAYARLNSDGLVWWRPDGVISATPDNDAAMVRLG